MQPGHGDADPAASDVSPDMGFCSWAHLGIGVALLGTALPFTDLCMEN
jgi:hypothetical protein